jgi:hypothetical protein
MKPMDRPDAKALLDRMWPAQVYVPRRSPDELARIAAVMNASTIPVAFNSFHPASRRDYLHLNQAAREFLGVRLGVIGGPAKYLPIDERAVQGALWLYLYGVDECTNPDGLVDGAYHRQFIVNELHHCDRIYITRPRNSRWDSRLPHNSFEIQDFTTELWFDTTYAAELASIRQINRLLAQGTLKPGSGFHPVQLIEVEVERPFGFFECCVEERDLFEQAFRKAYRELTANECGIRTPSPLP